MSRAQQGAVIKTASGQNAVYNANAQTSYDNAQADEGKFEDQLAKYTASNPYVQGGQAQTVENQQMANTADAGAQSAGQSLQSAAVRTGQNPAGAIAATEAMQEENTRNLGAAEADATENRIANEAGYNAKATELAEQPASFEAQLAGQQGQLAQGTLNTQEQAAQTPSFMDQLGGGLITAGDDFAAAAGKAAAAAAGCWVAAELFGGWDDVRTIEVRRWLLEDFSRRWYGGPIYLLYIHYGERLAEAIKTRRLLRAVMKSVFTHALLCARKGR